MNMKFAVKSLCEHNKQRGNCIECGGSQICLHKKIKCRCRDCGGNSFCEHNKRKDNCIDCKGPNICEHNRQRNQCKDCNNFICEICNIKLSSSTKLKKHMNTKKHIRILRQLEKYNI
jgi:hypothetical protein